VLPHLNLLAQCPFVFKVACGLDELPEEPGVILVRGARQYGKSTWLEGQIRQTVETFGPGSAALSRGSAPRYDIRTGPNILSRNANVPTPLIVCGPSKTSSSVRSPRPSWS